MWTRRFQLLCAWAALAAPVAAVEWSGFVALESRLFLAGDGEAGQTSESQSLVLQPELYWEWDGGDQTFRFTPFLRWDQHDGERSHADVRELYWLKAARGWELAVGVRKVFWGVTESAHLVDVVNQTDLVEDLDGEQKLGQPAVQLSLIRPWGTFDFFVLPFFRERTFPGRDGRLRTRPAVAADLAEYESPAGREHLDYAVRWSRSVGLFDIGLSHFAGTGRDPLLVPAQTGSGEAALKPFYQQIDQTGLDLQATVGPWLWKLEAISRWSERRHLVQALGGFEFTFFNVRGGGLDVGLLSEYFVDDRDEVEDSIFFGTRLTFNDVQSTDLLLGAVVDAGGGTLLNLEASRRLRDRWRLSVRLRAFTGVAEAGPLRPFRDDDYLEVELSRFF